MTVQLSRIGELALITLDRPEVLNALNFELLRDLGAAIDQVADGEARALLVTGAGSRPRPPPKEWFQQPCKIVPRAR